jgi:hypothetical protein
MRKVIKYYVEACRPIPVLIATSAWKLPIHGHGVDLAEVLFVHMMIDLQIRIRAIYSYGLKIYIRLEDLTLMALFPETSNIQSSIAQYIQDFNNILILMKVTDFIVLRPESSLMSMSDFMSTVTHSVSMFERYILASDVLQVSPNISCEYSEHEYPCNSTIV